jgi:MFS family permease
MFTWFTRFPKLNQLLHAELNLKLFILAVIFLGINDGAVQVTLHNYLVEIFGVGAIERGNLEFPRELPGFLVFFFISILFFLKENRIALLASLSIFLGMIGLAFLTFSNLFVLIIWMFLWSLGMHVLMPVTNTMALDLSKRGQGGSRLGQMRGIRNFSFVVGAGLVGLLMGILDLPYAAVYASTGVLVLIGGFLYVQVQFKVPEEKKRFQFIVHKRYTLFYFLNLLFGVRKQMFLTFAPLVLILYHGLKVEHFSILFLISASLSTFTSPFMGKLVDRLGERTILVIDSILLFAVTFGYAHITSSWAGSAATYILCGLFIFDHVMFGARVAHVTYLNKILIKKSHLTPTLSLGTTIDHLFAMSMPALGGLLWYFVSYQAVFYAVAGVAVLMFLCSFFVTGREDPAIVQSTS